MARFIPIVLSLLSLFQSILTAKVPDVEYDVIVVGGGPGGLSTVSALSGVGRETLIFDSGSCRNDRTRNMHDVIGDDVGDPVRDDQPSTAILILYLLETPPVNFRTAARAQIAKYGTAVMKDATIVDITCIKNPEGHDWYVALDIAGHPHSTSCRPRDWRNRPAPFHSRSARCLLVRACIGVLGAMVLSIESNHSPLWALWMTLLASLREIATNRSATWEAQFAAYNIPIVNTTIKEIVRLRDANGVPVRPKTINSRINRATHQQELLDSPYNDITTDADNSGPNGKHKDYFRVDFTDGTSIERAAFLINIELRPTSDLLPAALNLKMDGPKIKVDSKMQTNMTGIFTVGDANTDGSTNVPHAMYTGKKAAVVAHAKEESLASLSKRDVDDLSMSIEKREELVMREVGDELEGLWEVTK